MEFGEDDAGREKAEELRRLADRLVEPAGAIVLGPEDLQIVVKTLMELLLDARDSLSSNVWLREAYEEFALELSRSGFRINERTTREQRAADQRRLGELAEARGDIAGAIVFYDLAMRSWPDLASAVRLDYLRTLQN
jgi:hypothetical protein